MANENKAVNTAVAEKAKAPKAKMTREEILEVVVVVLLGLVTVLTAWASWISSLHGGNQATNYTKSNNLSAEGNSMWNQGVQDISSDMQLWDRINDLKIEYAFAEANEDEDGMEKAEWKIDQLLTDSASEELMAAIEWADSQEEYASPFDMEGFADSYFVDASDVLAEAQEILEQGQKDNAAGDAYGLVSVIYSIVLFLLGILSSFKSEKNKMALVIVSVLGIIFATIYMVTLPMPTGFSLGNFFQGN